MNTKLATYLALLLTALTAVVAPSSYGLDEYGCTNLANGCLSRSMSRRDECFKSIVVSPLCVGTKVGELIAKRARLTPGIPGGMPEGPAFLGPQEYDRTCLDSFDLQLGSSLNFGTLTTEKRQALNSHIERCTRAPPPSLYRP